MEKEISHKCLVVDDEIYFIKYLKILLEQNGFEVTDCDNTEDAIELLKHQYFDIIFSDIIKPKIPGFDLLYEIKNDSKMRQFPVVIITNRDDHSEKALKLGASGFIRKPFLRHHVSKISDLLKGGKIVLI